MHTSVQAATIANGASLSGAISLRGGRLSAIQMPAAWTAANLTFQTSFDGATFADAYDDVGNELTVSATISRVLQLDPSKWVGVQYIKVRSGTSASPVAQGAARTLQLILVE
jgi:hypothetical protein